MPRTKKRDDKAEMQRLDQSVLDNVDKTLDNGYDKEAVQRDIEDTINRAEGNFLQRNGVAMPEKKTKKRTQRTIIGTEQVNRALEILQKYKDHKANLEKRVIDNEEWWKLRNWECMRDKSRAQTEPTSAWLFNSIMNKLADFSDNFPEANIRARTKADVEEAERIKNVLPMIMEANDFEDTYMDVVLSKVKNGTGIIGVFWNRDRDDIDIRPVDLLTIYWEPGIKNIQASRNVFTVELVDNDVLKERYPDKEFKTGGEFTKANYLYEDAIETTEKSAVIDWYYKKKGILHYCKFCNGTVIIATENEPDLYPNGLYDDGEYPFIVDTLYKMEGTIAGFGLLDVCKSPQEYIDRMDQAIIQNALMCARPRYFLANGASVNTAEFLDWNTPLVSTGGNLATDDIRLIEVRQLDAAVYNARDGKIQELKQTSGNADVNTGTAANGVTAASAISQLIETGSKGSRHAIKGTYRAYRRLVYMIIERMRQFYDEPRYVRITDEDGSESFTLYDNEMLKPQPRQGMFGDTVERLPMFDIEVSAQKASPYSKMSQNELMLQFYSGGIFAPENADTALAAISGMDFEHKQDVVKQVERNGTMYQALMQMQQENQQLKMLVDLAYNSNLAGGQQVMPQSGGGIVPVTPEALGKTSNSMNNGDGSNSRAEQMRKQAADATEVM